jgi:hypothetical protein
MATTMSFEVRFANIHILKVYINYRNLQEYSINLLIPSFISFAVLYVYMKFWNEKSIIIGSMFM